MPREAYEENPPGAPAGGPIVYYDDQPGLATAFPQLVLRGLRAIWPLVLAAAIYACACVGLWRNAEAHYDQPMAAVQSVELVDAPEWLTPAQKQSVDAIAETFRGRSLFEKSLTKEIAYAMLENQWVEGVRSVRRRFPDGVQVDMVYRRPVARVRLGRDRGFALIDRLGVRLPASSEGHTSLPVISGSKAALPRPGLKYQNRGIADALEIIGLAQAAMQDIPKLRGMVVRGVDIAATRSRDRDHTYVLHGTDARGKPVRVIWGTHYGSDEIPPAAVPLTSQKLRKLRSALATASRTGQSASLINVSVASSIYPLAPTGAAR